MDTHKSCLFKESFFFSCFFRSLRIHSFDLQTLLCLLPFSLYFSFTVRFVESCSLLYPHMPRSF